MSEINFFWDPLSDNILRKRDETGAVTAEYRRAGPLRQHPQPEPKRGREPVPLRRSGLDPGRDGRQPERHRNLRHIRGRLRYQRPSTPKLTPWAQKSV